MMLPFFQWCETLWLGQTVVGSSWLFPGIATGVPLFLSEPIKLYYSPSFWLKISVLPIAILFAFTIRPRVLAESVRNTARRQALVGALSIALWVTVAAAGR